ncbi:MAG: hypothetical protein U0075_08815 [Thermomicrobiales bacterium]
MLIIQNSRASVSPGKHVQDHVCDAHLDSSWLDLAFSWIAAAVLIFQFSAHRPAACPNECLGDEHDHAGEIPAIAA